MLRDILRAGWRRRVPTKRMSPLWGRCAGWSRWPQD